MSLRAPALSRSAAAQLSCASIHVDASGSHTDCARRQAQRSFAAVSTHRTMPPPSHIDPQGLVEVCARCGLALSSCNARRRHIAQPRFIQHCDELIMHRWPNACTNSSTWSQGLNLDLLLTRRTPPRTSALRTASSTARRLLVHILRAAAALTWNFSFKESPSRLSRRSSWRNADCPSGFTRKPSHLLVGLRSRLSGHIDQLSMAPCWPRRRSSALCAVHGHALVNLRGTSIHDNARVDVAVLLLPAGSNVAAACCSLRLEVCLSPSRPRR